MGDALNDGEGLQQGGYAEQEEERSRPQERDIPKRGRGLVIDAGLYGACARRELQRRTGARAERVRREIAALDKEHLAALGAEILEPPARLSGWQPSPEKLAL